MILDVDIDRVGVRGTDSLVQRRPTLARGSRRLPTTGDTNDPQEPHQLTNSLAMDDTEFWLFGYGFVV